MSIVPFLISKDFGISFIANIFPVFRNFALYTIENPPAPYIINFLKSSIVIFFFSIICKCVFIDIYPILYISFFSLLFFDLIKIYFYIY